MLEKSTTGKSHIIPDLGLLEVEFSDGTTKNYDALASRSFKPLGA
jgi:hypothetical protein